MAITISGENNNDRILASDGVIDQISGINIVGVLTATSFTGDLTGDVTGNLTGNVTGNINNSTLLLQTGGTERLRITSTGSVLIGSSTNTGHAGADDLVVANDSGHAGMTIRSGTSNDSQISFADGTSGNAQYMAQIIYNHTSDYLYFRAAGPTERFRLDANGAQVTGALSIVNGNLALPDSIVHSGDGDTKIVFTDNQIDFQAAGSSRLKVSQYAVYVQSGLPLAFLASSGATPHIKSGGTNAQDLLFTTGSGNPTRLHIKSNGNIGIGTDNPDALLHLMSASSPTIYLQDTTQNSKLKLYAQDSSTVIGNYSNHALQFVSNSISRIQLTNDGKLQIGLPGGSNSLPGAVDSVSIRARDEGNLHIRDIGNLTSSPAGTGVGIDVLNNASNAVKDLCIRASTLIFRHASDETLRINSSGHLSLGGSNVTDVNMITINGTGQTQNIGIVFNKTNSPARAHGINVHNGSGDLIFYDYTVNAETIRITTQGRIGLNGVVPTSSHANVTSSIHLADSNTILSRTGNQYFALYQNLKQTSADVTRYLVNGYASAYVQHTGTHRWYTVGNGTGNTNATVTERLRIANDGKIKFATSNSTTDYFEWGANPRLYLKVPSGTNGLRIDSDTTPLEIRNSSANGRSLSFGSGGTSNFDIVLSGDYSLSSSGYDSSPKIFFNTTRHNGSTTATSFQCSIQGVATSNTNNTGYLGLGASASPDDLVIKTNGYVGVNETSPQQQLHVHDDTNYKGILINGNSAPRIAFARSTTTTGEWSVGIDGTNGNNFVINRSNDNSNRYFVISNGQTNSNQNTVVNGVLFNNDIRSTTATNDDSTSHVSIAARNAAAGHGEYFIVGVSGNVYFGAGANNYSSNPSGNNINGGTTIRVYGGISSNAYNDAHRFGRNTDGSIVIFQSAGGTEGSIAISGSTTNYNTSSDYRLKDNIVNITDGITRLKQLKPRRFNFIKDPSITKDGFIAHEVDSVVPEAVTGTKDETFSKDDEDNNVKAGDPKYQQMDASKLIPLLTAALQEAITEIETLKTKVAALEGS